MHVHHTSQTLCFVRQVVLFVDDVTVSKPMVKYATGLPRESIVDVEGEVTVPDNAVESCSQSAVEIKCSGIKAISRSALLPFEVIDAGRTVAQIQARPAMALNILTTLNILPGRTVPVRCFKSWALCQRVRAGRVPMGGTLGAGAGASWYCLLC